MSKKTLLLNASYEVLAFIPERKAFKLLCKEKVEVISSWDDLVNWGKEKINHPSILRLKNHVKRNYFNSNFSRKALVKRDKSSCFVPDTFILMHDGSLKKIKDVEVKDKIIDAFGNLQTVEYVYVKDVFNNELLEIKQRGNGNTLKCTQDHKFITTTWNRSIVNNHGIKASSLSDCDYLYSIIPQITSEKLSDDLLNYNKELKFIKVNDLTIKNYCGNVTTRFFNYDNDLGKLIGFFLAEGSCDERTVRFSFHLKEKQYANEVKSLLKKIFGLKARIEMNKLHHQRNVIIGSIFLSNFFKTICYLSYQDNIKGFSYKKYPKSFLQGIIYGIMCGDGTFNEKQKRVTLQLKLFNLINDVSIISNMIGLFPTISKDGFRKDNRSYKSLNYNSTNYNKIIKLCNRNISKWKPSPSSKSDRNIIGNMIISKIQSIRSFNYTGKVYDLQVSGSHTYIANGVAVHNCQYCGKKLTAAQITIDHVLPKAQGGVTSFTNCVVCCQICNNRKADRTPEQAGLVLMKKPTHPSFAAHYNVADPQEYWHHDWDDFLGYS